MRTRTLGKDVEDEAGSIQYTAFQGALEIALLAGSQSVIEDDQLDLAIPHEIMEFLDLAASDEEFGRRLMPGDIDEANLVCARRPRQLPELLRIFTRRGILAIQVNQDGALSPIGTFEEQ